ncbi:MAG: lysophospholipid acyltransferase family protein [Pseudomonadota bacterium]
MTGKLRIIYLAMVITPVTMVLAPLQYLLVRFAANYSGKIPMLWHRMILHLAGVKVKVQGEVARETPLMIVSNHISWLDIIVLGSVAELSFISKHEVDELPGANWLARLQRTVFIVRDKRREAGKQAREITDRLLAGDTMVLFAEGTTGDGHHVMDFKSALFGAAQYAVEESKQDQVYIQPVALAYTGLHGITMARHERINAAWTGDMDLGPHVSRFLKRSGWQVTVTIGDPIGFDGSKKRRAVAGEVHAEVRKLFHSNLGRQAN